MKHYKYLFLLVCLLISTAALAQGGRQVGYVKTPGRLGKGGRVVAGTRIPNATVTLKGGGSTRSASDGTFTITLPGGVQKFYLQNVQKIGYTLVDPEVLSRQHTCNANPFILVMEVPSQQAEYQLAQEKKLRETTQRELQKREKELNELRRKNKLTEQEYERRLQELLAQQETNEKMIAEMAERYARMDFDQIDEFNRRIADYILDGRLEEADSLIRSKGDIHERINKVQQEEALERKERAELEEKLAQLEQSEAGTQAAKEDIAQDCYHRFEIFKFGGEIDSAAYYIILRANLDTTNVDYALDAGIYIEDYGLAKQLHRTPFDRDIRALEQSILANEEATIEKQDIKDLVIYFYNRAYENAIEQYGENSPQVAKCLVHLGNMYASEDIECYFDSIDSDTEFSIDALKDVFIEYFDALAIYDSIYGQNNEASANVLQKIALASFRPFGVGFFEDEALECSSRALEIYKNIYGDMHPQTAVGYIDRGNTQYFIEKAFADYDSAQIILEHYEGEKRKELIYLYKSIAAQYYRKEAFVGRINAQDPSYHLDFSDKEKNGQHQLTFNDFSEEDFKNYQAYQELMIRWSDELEETFTGQLNAYEKALDITLDLYGKWHFEVYMLENSIQVLREQINENEQERKEAEKELLRIKNHMH